MKATLCQSSYSLFNASLTFLYLLSILAKGKLVVASTTLNVAFHIGLSISNVSISFITSLLYLIVLSKLSICLALILSGGDSFNASINKALSSYILLSLLAICFNIIFLTVDTTAPPTPKPLNTPSAILSATLCFFFLKNSSSSSSPKAIANNAVCIE